MPSRRRPSQAGATASLTTGFPTTPSTTSWGVRRQRREVHDYAAAHQVRIVAEYVDDDRSAFVAKHRPDYEQMLDHAGSPSVHVVLAWHPDRLTRGDLIEVERIITRLGGDAGKPIETVQTGPYDLAHPAGRMVARITGSVARYESEHKSARLRSKHMELATDGKPNGGRRATGYHRDGVTPATPESFPCDHPNAENCTARPTEAAMVAELIERVAAGETMTAIGDDFNGGCPGSRGS